VVDDEPIRQQLNTGEQLLWSGQPRQGFRATFEEQEGACLLIIIVLLLLCLFVVVIGTVSNLWDVEGQFNSGALIAGLILLAIGGTVLYFVCNTVAMVRKHTVYGLTDQRIIHVTEDPSRVVRSYPLHQLHHMAVQVRADGSGTITFEDISYTHFDTPVVLSFKQIEKVQMVYVLIDKAKEQAHGRGPDD
jgi:hypothetical protein